MNQLILNLTKNVHVYYEDQLWKVKSTEARRASDTFDTKSEAVNRAQHIAENKRYQSD